MSIKEQHGGNIYKKAKELGIPQEEILDFSANINPLGLPGHVRKAMEEAIDGTINYPDPEASLLREMIGNYDAIPPDYVVCGNGGADMLYRLAYGLRPKKILLPVPSFSEYEEAFKAAGGEFVWYEMGEDLTIREDILDRITGEIDLLVVCNPNNPTGILTDKGLLIRMMEKAAGTGTRVLIDECFLEICREWEDYSLIPDLDRFPNGIILKSFTKLFAIPGVRLGYTLCSDQAVNDRLTLAGQAWPVSYIAQKAGEAACSDPEYRKIVVDLVSKENAFMKSAMEKMPVRLYDGRANYIFFRAPGITDLDKRLEAFGIMIRNCSNYRNLGPDYWRVAVKSHQENIQLLQALSKVVEEKENGGNNG